MGERLKSGKTNNSLNSRHGDQDQKGSRKTETETAVCFKGL